MVSFHSIIDTTTRSALGLWYPYKKSTLVHTPTHYDSSIPSFLYSSLPPRLVPSRFLKKKPRTHHHCRPSSFIFVLLLFLSWAVLLIVALLQFQASDTTRLRLFIHSFIPSHDDNSLLIIEAATRGSPCWLKNNGFVSRPSFTTNFVDIWFKI